MGILNKEKKCTHCDRNRDFVTGSYCKFHQSIIWNKIDATPEDEKRFWSTSNCEICNKIVEGKNKCIDHDHNTGEFRGILCQRCNQGIGKFEDSETIIKKAYEYIRRSP